jgi:hypothetical protein
MNPSVKLELNTIGELEISKVRVARCDERWMDVVFRRRHGLRNAAVETVRADDDPGGDVDVGSAPVGTTKTHHALALPQEVVHGVTLLEVRTAVDRSFGDERVEDVSPWRQAVVDVPRWKWAASEHHRPEVDLPSLDLGTARRQDPRLEPPLSQQCDAGLVNQESGMRNVRRKGRTFHEENAVALPGQEIPQRRACDSRTDDDNIISPRQERLSFSRHRREGIGTKSR